MVAIHNDLGAQFSQHARRGLVSRSVGAVHNEPQAFQSHAAREGGLGLLNVAAERIIDAHRLAHFVSRGTNVFYLTAEHQAFYLMFDFIVELIPIRSEEL